VTVAVVAAAGVCVMDKPLDERRQLLVKELKPITGHVRALPSVYAVRGLR
jgi:hypothetical protein